MNKLLLTLFIAIFTGLGLYAEELPQKITSYEGDFIKDRSFDVKISNMKSRGQMALLVMVESLKTIQW